MYYRPSYLEPSEEADALINNIPSESVKGNDSNLKELNEKKDGIIKKIFKSNYNELIKKHKKDHEKEKKVSKWTDPDFPPEQSSIGDGSSNVKWERIP